MAARGFRIQCNKWAIIVRLLLGEIPERTVFMQKGMKEALIPYFELTNVSFSLLLDSLLLDITSYVTILESSSHNI
jgi:hypothetical protein